MNHPALDIGERAVNLLSGIENIQRVEDALGLGK